MSTSNSPALATDHSRQQIALGLTLEMRTPLARVELAASQLAREALTPVAAEWAEGISEAVRQLDRILNRVLGVLTVERSAAGRDQAMGPVVSSLRARFAPLLASRGIRWEESSDSGTSTQADPDEVRILAVALLRIVTLLSEGGGSFCLDPVAGEDRVGLALHWRVEGEHAGESTALGRGLLEELQTQAITRGAEVELGDGPPGRSATVWMSR